VLGRLDDAIPPCHRAGPEEIGRVVTFVAGDAVRSVTATTSFVDGGIKQTNPGL
jgi:glucose 1-dehydrogenase